MNVVKVSDDKKNSRDYPVSMFVIPFRYDRENIGIQRSLLSKKGWKVETKLKDNEFFSHIKFLIDDKNCGSICYLYRRNNIDAILRSKVNDSYSIKIKDIELYLFKTGVGFYRFSVLYHSDVTIDDIISINNALKSIERNSFEVIINKEIIQEFKEEFIKSSMSDHSSVTAIDYTNKGKEVKIDSRIFQNINKEQDVKITFGEHKKRFIRYKTIRKYDLRDFLNEELSEIKKVSYFNQFSYENGKKQMAAKANVFFSCLLDNNTTQNKIKDIIYLLSRGYKGSYKKTIEEEDNNFFSTFDNSYWSVSREGVANITFLVDDDTTNTFFKGTYLDRIDNYFFLYILALHQYYGLIKVAQDISQLPSSIKDYSDNNDNYEKLIEMYDEVNFSILNVFIMK